MDTFDAGTDDSPSGIGRRGLLRGALAAGVAGAMAPTLAGRAGAAGAASGDWGAFDASLQSAFDRIRLVGAAVAVVSKDQVLHTTTLGSRSLSPRRKVTTGTHFNVASTTKSMTALLVATYVRDGVLGWDQKVIDAWSGFRAPTDELTRSLRVRDLLGMASGIGEPPATSAIHEGDPTAPQLLQSVVNLPVIAKPNTTYFYNNTVYAIGGYLPFLAKKVAPADLPAAYANAMQERLFRPARMTSGRIADDPRGLVDDYATGNVLDLQLKAQTVPFAPVGSYAPVGGTIASLDDMAAYVRLQLRNGVSVNGSRVIDAANLAEIWKPHVKVDVDPDLDPAGKSAGYAMGWIHETFKDGTSLIWHNGGIDGFTSYIGFLPERDLGVVILNAMNTGPNGVFFYLYVLNLLLSGRFGLNQGVPEKVLAASDAALAKQRALGTKSQPVNPKTVEPYLGFYEGGYSVVRQGRNLEVHVGPRIFPLEAQPDGSYIATSGLVVGLPVHFRRDADGVAVLELVGVETVRRTTGL